MHFWTSFSFLQHFLFSYLNFFFISAVRFTWKIFYFWFYFLFVLSLIFLYYFAAFLSLCAYPYYDARDITPFQNKKKFMCFYVSIAHSKINSATCRLKKTHFLNTFLNNIHASHTINYHHYDMKNDIRFDIGIYTEFYLITFIWQKKKICASKEFIKQKQNDVRHHHHHHQHNTEFPSFFEIIFIIK